MDRPLTWLLASWNVLDSNRLSRSSSYAFNASVNPVFELAIIR